MRISKTKSITLIAIMTALTIIGAYISVPIPNLPFTMQTFFAVLSGLLLVKKDAVLSQVIYIILGLIGLPVFAGGGGGIAYVLRPTFGYILCLPIIALIISSFKERNVYLVVYVSVIVTLIIGGSWLSFMAKLYIARSVWNILLMFVIVYIPIEILKGTIAIIIYRRLKNYI